MTSRPASALRPVSKPASRRMGTSPLRRATQLVLGFGTVLAAGSIFGPSWLLRMGVAVAIATGLVACALAWRELFWSRRQHAKAVLAASHEHRTALTAERLRNAAVVDTLSERVRSAGTAITGYRLTIAQLRTQIAVLRTDKTHLIAEVARREATLCVLQNTIATRDAEQATRQAEDEAAPIRHMPRRVLMTEEPRSPEDLRAERRGGDRSHPAVLDRTMIETAMVLPSYMVLPNYEDDRQAG